MPAHRTPSENQDSNCRMHSKTKPVRISQDFAQSLISTAAVQHCHAIFSDVMCTYVHTSLHTDTTVTQQGLAT